jgi:hypothetical protein
LPGPDRAGYTGSMNEIVDAQSGGVTFRVDLDFEAGRWSSFQPPEGEFPFVVHANGKRYLLYSDTTFGEVEDDSKDRGGVRAIENSLRDTSKFKVGDAVCVTKSAIQRLPELREEYVGKVFTVVEVPHPEYERPEFDTPTYYIRGHGLTDSLFYEYELEPVLNSTLP